MLLHTVTVTVRRNIKVISPYDGMMAKCFQHDNFCHTLICVCWSMRVQHWDFKNVSAW